MAHDATAQEQGAGATVAAGAATGAKVPGALAAAAGGDHKRMKSVSGETVGKRLPNAKGHTRHGHQQRDLHAVALLDQQLPKERGAAFMVIDF